MDFKAKQARILLWSAPRCTTCAFLVCMINRPNTKVIREPFLRAYYFGPDKRSDRFTCDHEEYDEKYTFDNIKKKLGDDFEEYETVFMKEMAYYMFDNKQTFCDHIIPGYKHTILIRDPRLAIPSMYRVTMVTKDIPEGWDKFEPIEGGFNELYQLYQILTRKGEKVVVIDSNDLLNQPEATLRMYCQNTGIEFYDSMVNWREMTDSEREYFEEYPGWHEDLFRTTALNPPKPINRDYSALPEEVQRCIEENMEAYQKLYELRLVPC